MEELVHEDVERQREMGPWYLRPEHRGCLVGRGVHHAADALDCFRVLASRGTNLSPLEQHVLDEMGHTRLGITLVAGVGAHKERHANGTSVNKGGCDDPQA